MCGILKDLGSFMQKIRALNFVYGNLNRASWRFKKNRVLNDKTITLPDNKMIEFYITKKESYADLKILFLSLSFTFNCSTPKIWLIILPSCLYTFPCKLVTRILVLDQENFYLIFLSILITRLLDNVWM